MQLQGRPKRLLAVLRQHRRLLIPPTVLLILVLALCLFAVIYATDSVLESQRGLMESTAQATAEAIQLQLSVVTGSAYTMATFVRVDPDWNQLAKDLPIAGAAVTREIERNSEKGISGIMYLPFGTVAAVYPEDSPLAQLIGGDAFGEQNLENLQPIETVKARRLAFVGPSVFFANGEAFLTARYPVFFSDVEEDEAWNHPFNMTAPSFCPPGLCYNATSREKFWGFVVAYVLSGPFFAGKTSQFDVLRSSNYSFKLVRRGPSFQGTDEEVLAESESFPEEESAQVAVGLPGADWYLYVYDPRVEETQDTRDGLIALIVVAAFIVSGLLLLLLTSNKEALLLLQEQVVINKRLGIAHGGLVEAKRELEAEKTQKEALLERQMKLISCFEQASSKRTSKQKTLDRITEARGRTSESNSQIAEDDDIQTLELLGEGTFGKVYKGLWRSTLVAIKVIMLPANMSMSEKREKMVVWEAAISSSLIHPNIVQTYSYSINSVKESNKRDQEGSDIDGLGSAVQICGSACSDVDRQNLPDQECKWRSGGSSGPAQQSLVHNFEVRLVLEYCDKGCLQEALNQEAFMGPSGLNYPAILDCAIDIARAMLHLHCNNVLHMDLKARNVMLASSGTESRGVSCKIADFGLAVRMEHLETHMSEMFQGTITHMAPEVLLEGRVSKAADVYAFGITLWELYTAGKPYQGVPKALLGHKVAKEGHRPSLPLVMPEGYRALLKKCWDQKPENRPSFAQALEELQMLRQEQPHPTQPLERIVSQKSSQASHKSLQSSPRDKKVKREASLSRLGSTSFAAAWREYRTGASEGHPSCPSVRLAPPPQRPISAPGILPWETRQGSAPCHQPQQAGQASVPSDQPQQAGQASVPSDQPQQTGQAGVPKDQPQQAGQASVPSDQPQQTGQAGVPNDQPQQAGQVGVPSHQPQQTGQASVPSDQPQQTGQVGVPSDQPQQAGQASVPSDQPQQTGQAGVPNDQPQQTGRVDVPKDQPQQAGQASVPIDRPQQTGQAGIPNDQPQQTGQVGVPSDQPQQAGQASVPSDQPQQTGQAGVPKDQPQQAGQVDVPKDQPQQAGQASVPNDQPQQTGQIGVPNDQPQLKGYTSRRVHPTTSSSRQG